MNAHRHRWNDPTLFDGLWNKTVVAMAPAIEAGGNFVSMLTDKMTPAIQWVGRVTQQFWDIAGPAFGAVTNAVSEGINSVMEWAGGIAGMSGVELPTLKETAVSVFKAIATVGGYAFDVIKFGVGLLAAGMGETLYNVSLLMEHIGDLADVLPDALKPAWLDGFVEKVEGASGAVKEAGGDLFQFGKRSVDEFGQSAGKFKGLIDQWADTPKKVKLSTEFVGPLLPPGEVQKAVDLVQSKFVANTAILGGSQAEQSTILRFQNDSVSVSKEQLREEKAQTKHLEKIAKLSEKIAGKTGPDYEEFAE